MTLNRVQGSSTPVVSLLGIPTQHLVTDTTTRVEGIQLPLLYSPDAKQFEHWVNEGKKLYLGLMTFFLSYFPRFLDDINIALGLLNNEIFNNRPIPSMLRILIIKVKHLTFNNKTQQFLLHKVHNINKLIQWQGISYKEKIYWIRNLKNLPWLTSDVQKMFYLLYLIRQENPKFLSVEDMKQREFSI